MTKHAIKDTPSVVNDENVRPDKDHGPHWFK